MSFSRTLIRRLSVGTGIALCAGLMSVCLAKPPSALDTSAYTVKSAFTLGGTGGWDYLTVSTSGDQLFIARSDRVSVVNLTDGTLRATVADTPGVHGVALAPSLGLGFTSNGRANTITIFDLKTLQSLDTMAIDGKNPDAIVYDEASHHLYTFNGQSRDISVIDPISKKVITTLPAGGKPEFAVSDGRGRLYFNIETSAQLSAIDTHSSRRVATWSLPHCKEPTGLALDAAHNRLFSVCRNGVMVVTHARTGQHIAHVPIGLGADAVAFDASQHLVFSANGVDGTVTVIHQDDANHYAVIDTVVTQKSARTLALNPITHQLYVVAADFAPSPPPSDASPAPRPAMIADSFRLWVVGQ